MNKDGLEKAFPLYAPSAETPEYFASGMTIRDYFAAAALQGFCANHKALKENVEHWKEFTADNTDIPRNMLAHTCYQLADAMLKTRETA